MSSNIQAAKQRLLKAWAAWQEVENILPKDQRPAVVLTEDQKIKLAELSSAIDALRDAKNLNAGRRRKTRSTRARKTRRSRRGTRRSRR